MFLPTYILIQLFVTDKSDQGPLPHGCALAWLPGSGSAMKPMRIHFTTQDEMFVGI